jgi:hypothetical protein
MAVIMLQELSSGRKEPIQEQRGFGGFDNLELVLIRL